MKILHVVPSLGHGGGEGLMIELANRAAADGHEVAVVAGGALPPERTLKGLSDSVELKFVSDNYGPKISRYADMLAWMWRNRRWLSEQDILHCHMTYAAVLGSILQIWKRIGGGRRPAVVETYHAVGMPIPKLYRWFHARMAAQRDALAFMTENDYWRAFLDKRPHIPFKIILSGVAPVDVDNVSEQQRLAYRRECGIPDDCRFVVTTIGRLIAYRMPWLYIPVFARVAERLGDDVHFIMGGDGVEADRVRALIQEHGVERQVHMVGLVRQIELPLAISDVFLSLNLNQWTGVVAFQAASARVPLVGVQMQSEYVARAEDWIWSSSDPEAVAERVVELLQSSEKRAALVQRQSAYLNEHHSVDAMTRSYYALYDAALERRSQRLGGQATSFFAGDNPPS